MRTGSRLLQLALLAGLALLGSGPPAAAAPAAAADQKADAQGPAGSAEVVWSASVEADPQEVKLGQPLFLTVRLKAKGGGAQQPEYGLPADLNLDPFVVLDREELPGGAGEGEVAVFRIKIASFEKVGQVQVPAFELVPRTDGGGEPIALPAVDIQVQSLLQGVDDPSPRDVAGPVEVRVQDYRLTVVAGLLLLWALMAFLLRRIKPAPEVPQRFRELPPPRLAHDIALEKLEQIVADDLLRQGKIHPYFTRISETLREYLGNRYGFYALDLTSRELIEELRDRLTPGLDSALLDQLLTDADLVKFARYEPPDSVCSRAINGTHAIVEATRVREVRPDDGPGEVE